MAKVQRSRPLPQDENNNAIQLFPAGPAIARTVSSSISSSTAYNLNGGTTIIRFYAVDKDVYIKWGTTAVTSSNFDEIIPAGQVVDLVVPINISVGTATRWTRFTMIESAATATIKIIEK